MQRPSGQLQLPKPRTGVRHNDKGITALGNSLLPLSCSESAKVLVRNECLFEDVGSVSWLDVAIPVAVLSIVLLVRGRQWKGLVNLVAGAYLIFFWSWALNYHRLPLTSKLEVDFAKTRPDAIEKFTADAAAE